ncbi:MAG: hemerythrin-like domain-containing protein [Candidatus Pseudothioglobus sp.]|jgi:hemerythrin-like domain-containing protein
MTTQVQCLLNDHRNLVRLLQFLREEIAHYDDPNIDTDLHSVLSALDYISTYTETFHHPLEEAAFDRMELLGIGERAVITRIREQHEELERDTIELKRLLEMVFDDHIVHAVQIKRVLNNYLDSQFQHIEIEERDIFPAMKQALSDDDWRQISKVVAERSDPLFHSSPSETYAELSRRLGLAELDKAN